MLTLKELKQMQSNIVFAQGEDMHFKWVAIRGEIHDWAVYQGAMYETYEEIARVGDKIYAEPIIKYLVPCDDEAFEMYRE